MLCRSCDFVLWQWQLMHNSPCKERGSKLYCFHSSMMVLEVQNLYLPKMHIWNKIAIIEKMIVLINERNEFEVVRSKQIFMPFSSCYFAA
jgi:hypothetical protein